jgi:HSP20 family protein
MEPFFPDPERYAWSGLHQKEPVVDMQDRGDHYLMTAELPGFEKKDVEVRVDSKILELRAEKSSDSEAKNKEGTSIQSGHSYFHRYMTLPEAVLSERVSGTMKNGVLELKLPKLKEKLPDKSRRVDLK